MRGRGLQKLAESSICGVVRENFLPVFGNFEAYTKREASIPKGDGKEVPYVLHSKSRKTVASSSIILDRTP